MRMHVQPNVSVQMSPYVCLALKWYICTSIKCVHLCFSLRELLCVLMYVHAWVCVLYACGVKNTDADKSAYTG